MHHRTALQLGVIFARAVDTAMLANKPLGQEAKQRLRNMAAEFIHAASYAGDTRAATAERKRIAGEAKKTEPFVMEWRSTGKTEHVTGWQALAIRVGLSEASVRSKISTGKGSFTRLMYDSDGNGDNVTITRVNYRRGVGRPKLERE